MRGKGKIGRLMDNKTHQVHEAMREKNKLLYQKEYERSKREADTLNDDIEFLGKIEDKFDPLEAYFKGEEGTKKRKKFA